MTKYFQVMNDKNILQIDDTYQNLILQRTGYMKAGSINLGENEILGAVRSVKSGVPFIVSQIDGRLVVTTEYINKDAEFQFYTFGASANTNQSNYGLEIYDETGNILFSSNRKYMRIAYSLYDEITLTWNEEGGDTYWMRDTEMKSVFQGKPGHVYALIQGQFPYFFYNFNPQGHMAGTMGIIQKGDSIGLIPLSIKRTDWTDTDCPRWLPPNVKKMKIPCNYTLIDVTGY